MMLSSSRAFFVAALLAFSHIISGCSSGDGAANRGTTPSTVVDVEPVIGITGYVIEPGTRGDSGLGNFRVTRTYRDALTRAGATPIHLVPVPAEDVENLLDRLDAVVLAGGPDIDPESYGEEAHPTVKRLPVERQSFDFIVARAAIKRGMPILGICLGSQELNVVHGGSMVQDIPSEIGDSVTHNQHDVELARGGAHEITIIEGTPLAELYDQSSFRVNSLHHQAADVLGEGLEPAARAPDGVIEAFYRPDYPFLIGVQYHPEIQREPEGLHDGLLRAFVEAAARYHAGDTAESRP